MDFEWDEEKNAANQEKHFISFEEAVTIFDGQVLRVVDDRKDYGEDRYIVHGELVLEEGKTVIIVITTERGSKTRIISARTGSRKERSKYYEYINQRKT